MVDVELSTSRYGRTTTTALIDTGAPRTVFPRGIGEIIGIDFPEAGDPGDIKIDLMGDRWPAITREIDLVLRPFDDVGWSAQVDFVLDEGLPFGLLGYEGFLNRWAVSFNAYLGYFVVETFEDFDGRIPVDEFEEMQRRWPDAYRP